VSSSTRLPEFPVLEIKAFVDATTAVLMGHRTHELEDGEELYVLGIGDTNIPGTDIPLITPKVKLEVTFPAQVYALARSTRESTGVNLLGSFAASMETFSRAPLTRDESQFIGNPARRPVRVGDVVVPAKRLGEYIKWRAARPEEATAT
jgi:hypothetical protein